MTARTEFPWIVSSTLGGRHTREILAEHYDQMCDEIDGWREHDCADSFSTIICPPGRAIHLMPGTDTEPVLLVAGDPPEGQPVVGVVTEEGIVPVLVDGEETP